MTDLADLALMDATTAPMLAPAKPRCRRHEWMTRTIERDTGDPATSTVVITGCARCGAVRNDAAARRGRNNRLRGGRAELVAARALNGRKVGPLGHPWDVEMPGYARLQVRKYARPESLRKIAAELARIGSGAEMPGYVWIEPGRGGERLVVFRLADFAERHGLPEMDAPGGGTDER